MTMKKVLLITVLALTFGSVLYTSLLGYYSEWLFLSFIGALIVACFWDKQQTVYRLHLADNNYLVATGGGTLIIIHLIALMLNIADPHHVYAAANVLLNGGAAGFALAFVDTTFVCRHDAY